MGDETHTVKIKDKSNADGQEKQAVEMSLRDFLQGELDRKNSHEGLKGKNYRIHYACRMIIVYSKNDQGYAPFGYHCAEKYVMGGMVRYFFGKETAKEGNYEIRDAGALDEPDDIANIVRKVERFMKNETRDQEDANLEKAQRGESGGGSSTLNPFNLPKPPTKPQGFDLDEPDLY